MLFLLDSEPRFDARLKFVSNTLDFGGWAVSGKSGTDPRIGGDSSVAAETTVLLG
jgi:hypothetical protein